MLILSITLGSLLFISVVFNIILFRMARDNLQENNFIVENITAVEFLIVQFLTHVNEIKKMSLYEGDETLIALFKHTQELAKQLDYIQAHVGDPETSVYDLLDELMEEELEGEDNDGEKTPATQEKFKPILHAETRRRGGSLQSIDEPTGEG